MQVREARQALKEKVLVSLRNINGTYHGHLIRKGEGGRFQFQGQRKKREEIILVWRHASSFTLKGR